MVISHNLAQLRSANTYNRNLHSLNKASDKLSTGYRIKRASDDAAGLAISEKMRAQIRGLERARRNGQDGIAMVQTFESAVSQSGEIIQRCLTLAEQSANGTYDNATDRAAAQLEFRQLSEELDHIADTDFNGVYLLNKSAEIVGYEEKVIKVPVGGGDVSGGESAGSVASKLFDSMGNPLLAPEKYSLAAEYGDLMGVGGIFAPKYIVRGEKVNIAFEEPDKDDPTKFFNTDKVLGTVNGTLNSQNVTGSFSFDYKNSFSTETAADTDGETIYKSICTGTYKLNDAAQTGVKLQLTQSAKKRIEYLTNAKGEFVLDSNGDKVVTARMWDVSYSLAAAPDDTTGFKLNSADIQFVADTVFIEDKLESYYTPDHTNGFLEQEKVYSSSNIIDSLSVYYFDKSNTQFKDITHKVEFDKSADGPDKLRLEDFWLRKTDPDYPDPSLPLYGEDEDGNPLFDLAYRLFWNNRQADASGTISVSAGSRGMASANSDKNLAYNTDPDLNFATGGSETGSEDIQYEDQIVKVPIYKPIARDMILQLGGRALDGIDFTLNYNADGIGDLKADLDCTAEGLGVNKLNLTTSGGANHAIDKLNNSLNKLSKIRASLGSVQNRLEHKLEKIAESGANLSAAESEIRDTDMAQEMLNYTKYNIVSQSAQSVTVQAGGLTQGFVNMLGDL